MKRTVFLSPLLLAVFLAPALMQIPDCGSATDLAVLELVVDGQNEVAFNPDHIVYSLAVPSTADTATVRVAAADAAASVAASYASMPVSLSDGAGRFALLPGYEQLSVSVSLLGASKTYFVNIERGSAQTEAVTFELEYPLPGSTLSVYVLGDLPQLGGDDVTKSVKLLSDDATNWRATVTLPLNRTYTYRFYVRYHGNPGDPLNGGPISDPISAETNTAPLVPAGKVIYVHSSFDPPVVHWRQGAGAYQQVTMEDAGPGRALGERRWATQPFGASGQPVELFLTNPDESEREPMGTDTYETPLDAFFLQDGELFTYVPALSVSPARRDYVVMSDGFPNTTMFSSFVGEDYEYRVFLPRGYEEHPNRHYPVLYMHDGSVAWDDALGSPTDLDGLINAELVARGLVGEMVMVAVDNMALNACGWRERRARDYLPPGNTGAPEGCAPTNGEADLYAAFITQELKPFIDSQYRTLADPSRTFDTGFSWGAVFAFYVAWEHDDIFSRIGAQSPGAGTGVTYFTRVADDPRPLARIYLDASGQGDFGSLGQAARIRDDLLTRSDEPFVLEQDLRFFVGDVPGHNRPACGSRWPEMLPFLYPATEEVPECYDGVDNDADGWIDYVPGAPYNDPDCTDALDDSE